MRADVVVVGGGVAGMSAVLAAGDRSILLVTKESLDESATRYAQGGIAAAIDFADTPELHLSDTVMAGAGLCDLDAVRVLVDEGPARVGELVSAGTRFDRRDGTFALTREGGHTRARILRAGGDATGAELQRSMGDLVRESAVGLIQDCRALELHVVDGTCRGLTVVDHDGERTEIDTDAVVLATGGAGALYEVTTNPDVATADGLAMALRAGAVVADLEFVQFHPTALVAAQRPRPLVSETVRGEGAVLRAPDGRRLMPEEHPMADLAPRDVVARAMFRTMADSECDHVWLDATEVEGFAERFPTVMGFLSEQGIDPTVDWLPVAPAAHYFCGGVVSDLWGRTSVRRLYACGEVACAGVHGANRLGSNSLLEGLVFGTRVGRLLATGDDLAQQPEGLARGPRELVAREVESVSRGPHLSIAELAHLMSCNAGVVRTATSLRYLLRCMQASASSDGEDPVSFGNLHLVARTLVRSALLREETRGTHVRDDHPESDPAWARHLYQRYLADGSVEVMR